MNPMHETHDELHDRLFDQALREKLGGQAPPDLTERILAAASAEPVTLASVDETLSASPRSWSWAVIAASIALIGTTVALLLPSVHSAREVARGPEPPAVESNLSNNANAKSEVSHPELPELPGLSASQSEPQSGESELVMMATPHVIVQKEEGLERNLQSVEGDTSAIAPAAEPVSGDGQQAEEHSLSRGRGLAPVADLVLGMGEPAAPGRRISNRGFDKSRFSWGTYSRGEMGGGGGFGGGWFGYDPTQGTGPGAGGDQYTRIEENRFVVPEGEQALSTFSIDVDTASYANVRQFLTQSRQLPPPDAVRIEELINYFDYQYAGPTSGDAPFAAHVEVAGCPWNAEHRLVRIGIKGREIAKESRPQSNLVFLIDVSGSMNEAAKLPLLVEGMKLLTRELGENDRVAIVVYASSEGLAMPSTRGDQQDQILSALGNLRAGGSTAGGAGIELAYQVAAQNFIKGGVNRVILATDGDFNVGVTDAAALERLAEDKAKSSGVFLTVLGFGRGNLNDAMMEKISGKGNGNYHYVDNLTEARKVLVEEMAGTLVTIAKDVKLQVEFNPAQVAGYRLIGYENRVLAAEDFNDDKKDAGEIGAGHTVTALYEIVPAGKRVEVGTVDGLKYQPAPPEPLAVSQPVSNDLFTLKIRYKEPDGDVSTKQEFPVSDEGNEFAAASDDFKFAAAAAGFGMLLRNSEYRGDTSYDAVLEIAAEGAKRDLHGYRTEFLDLVRQAKLLTGE